jgi:hypothetical protein
MSLDKIKPYAKAVVAFLVPTAGSLVGAMQDASPGGSTVTAAEWIGALIIGVTSSGFVYGTPNRDPLALRQNESVQPPYVGKHGEEGDDPQTLIARH